MTKQNVNVFACMCVGESTLSHDIVDLSWDT
jgi:hypothetical protein